MDITNNMDIINNTNNMDIIDNTDYINNDDIINNINNSKKNKIKNNCVKNNSIVNEIPKINDFNDILERKYTVTNLKIICKYYKIKIIGTKSILVDRIYNHLKNTFYVLKIQRTYRNYLYKLINYYKGPARINRKICVNETDFLTMEQLNDINYYQFISYRDNDNYIYGFDVISLYNWVSKSFKETKDLINPYNRKGLPIDLINNLRLLLKLGKVLNLNIITSIENEDDKVLSIAELNNNRVIQLFQNIDSLGFYTDIKWFQDLNYYSLIRYIKELYDIWTYRAQLTYEIKNKICPNMDPFINSMFIINITVHHTYTDINILKSTILNIIDKLINYGINRDYKYLGSSYVLAALTLVNSNAANSIPWLYQSVA